MRIDVFDATPEMVAEMAWSMREADRREAFYQCGMEPREALGRTVEHSAIAKAGYVDGNLVCMWGVAVVNPLAGEGAPWMIGTDKIEQYQVPFLRRSCYYLNEMKAGFDRLANYVHVENRLAVNWLRWMGLKMYAPEPHGPYGIMFHPFEWVREDVL